MSPASRLTATLTLEDKGVQIPLNSGPDDTYGVDWRISPDGLEGWDSPDLEEGATQRSGMDGLWTGDNYYGGRTITLKGVYSAPSYQAREAAAYRLAAAADRTLFATLQVNETVPKRVAVRRSGRLMVRPVTETIGEYSLSLLAPDPRKYGLSLSGGTITGPTPGGGLAPPWTPPVLIPANTSGATQITLTNSGDSDTPISTVIRGPSPPSGGIAVTNSATGRQLLWDIVLGPGDYIAVDPASGTALLNGSALRYPAAGSCVLTDWLAVRGDNLIRIVANQAATPPSADLSIYSAWI